MDSYSAVVLAGGRATRLGGANKARLEVGGVPLIDRVIAALRPLADQIVVVGHLAGEVARPGVEVVPDAFPSGSTLVGIYSGLRAARNDLALVVGCDMPFLSTPMLRMIARMAEGYDLAVPRVGTMLEALHAAYRRSCLPAMELAIERQQFKIVDLYPLVRVREVGEEDLRAVDPNLRSFFNVNTPSDLERARALVAQRETGIP
ncbi:MAG: molybdenum cofactor guanylyltransferase [Sphingomonadaceae bacterium]